MPFLGVAKPTPKIWLNFISSVFNGVQDTQLSFDPDTYIGRYWSNDYPGWCYIKISHDDLLRWYIPYDTNAKAWLVEQAIGAL